MSAADDFFGTATKTVKTVEKKVDKATAPVDNSVGHYFADAKKNPYGAVMNVLGAPQRAALSFLNDENIAYNVMHPNSERHLMQAFKNHLGIGELEKGALAGSDLAHKVARGVVDTATDVASDPLSVIPVGKVASLARKVPMIDKAVVGTKAAIGSTDAAKGFRGIFSPNDSLHLLTPHGKNTVQAVANVVKEKYNKLAGEQAKVLARHANDIRELAGKEGAELPGPVKELFNDPANIPNLAEVRRPQDVLKALGTDRAIQAKREVYDNLRTMGLSGKSSTTKKGAIVAKLRAPDKFFADASPEGISAAQKQVRQFVDGKKAPENNVSKFIAKAQRNANQAFLALPFAHGSNLTNLAYNRYGPIRTLQGLGNAARVATNVGVKGTKLEKNIHELEKTGAHSQYGNIFNELGFTDFGVNSPVTKAAAKAVNPIAIRGQRVANKLQNVFLNPLETGLRAAALDAEKRAGKTGVDAAASIHGAFGSEPANALTEFGTAQSSPFVKFHLQTAPGSFLRTLATNPGRVSAPLKADRDINAQVSPGSKPKFHLTTPTFAGSKMISNPIQYAKDALAGPVGTEFEGPYSTAGLIQKGKVREAVMRLVASHVPLSQALDIVREIATKQKGRAGQTGYEDIAPLLVGGYYSKKY